MGSAQSKDTQQHNPTDKISISHDKFSKVCYISQHDLLQISLQVESEADYIKWAADLKRIDSFDKQTLLLPRKYSFESRRMCGSSGTLKIYFENFEYLFEEEVLNRMKTKKYFEEPELWYLLYSLVTNANSFARLQQKIGDIRPYNIFINESGQIKVANIYSWPQENTNFDKTAYEKHLTYLSPQEMDLIVKGSFINTTDPIASQSFSIGVTMLHSGLLYNCAQLYSLNKSEFSVPLLLQKINEWNNLMFVGDNHSFCTYSPTLKNLIKDLCQIDPTKRITSLQVYKILKPYEINILQLLPFNVDLPIKQNIIPDSRSIQPNIINPQKFSRQPQLDRKQLSPSRQQQLGRQLQQINRQRSISQQQPLKTQYKQQLPSITYQPYELKPTNPSMMLPNGQHYIQTQHISYQNNIPQTVFRNNISSESDHRNAFTPQNNMIMRMVEPTYDIPRYSQPRASSSRSGSNADMLRKIDQQLEESRRLFPS